MSWAALILSLTDCQCSWLWGYSLRYTIAFNRRTKGLTPWRAGFWQECEIGELCRVGKKHLNSRDMLTCGHKALWCSVSLLIKAVTVSSPSWSFVSSKMKYLWGRDRLMNYKLVIIIGMYYLMAPPVISFSWSSSRPWVPYWRTLSKSALSEQRLF